MTAPALELRGIVKRFGPVQALRGADFTLMPGEVHALLGENGAGKSTLMRIAYGLERADAGTVVVRGVPGAPSSPRAARRLGIGMVHQHFTAIPALTVAENVALAAGWPVAPGRLRSRVGDLARRTGLELEPDATAGALSVALKQRLEILKALAGEAGILLLDEPTAVLAPAESDELLARIRGLARGGGAAVLITHKLREALEAADRITVLRAGRVTLTGRAAELSAAALTSAMIGGAAAAEAGPAAQGEVRVPAGERAGGEILVRCAGLDVLREDGRGMAVRGAALAVARGERLGVAAVEGNGQRELLRAIAGVLRPLRGTLEVAGEVAFIPEDRTTEALIPEFSLAENVVLGVGRGAPWVRRGRIDWRAAREHTRELLARFDVRASGPDAPAFTLSGGNQQKLVIARALARGPRVIVAENPSRGLDVRATEEVWGRLRAAAAAGAAVIAYSTDLDEILSWVGRVIVLSGGRVLEPPPGAGRSELGALMLAGREPRS